MYNDEVVEISKSRLALLEGVSKLNNELWNDPEHGITIKEIVKKKYPNANIPEVDVIQHNRKTEQDLINKVETREKAVDEKISAFEKKWSEKEESEKNQKAEAEFAAEVKSTKDKYRLTQEGMEKVFARMKEKNNPDVEAAAAWVTDHEIKASPVTSSSYSPQNMDLYGSNSGDKEWEDLNKNPIKYGDKVLAEMANDFANGNFGRYKEFGGDL